MVVRSILCGILSRWNTASLRLIQDSRRSPSIRHICGYFFLNKKQETCSCKKNRNVDFLRWHYPYQVKGSKFDDFLSACLQAPLFLFTYLMILFIFLNTSFIKFLQFHIYLNKLKYYS